MFKFVKRLLYKNLSAKNYLLLTSKAFFITFNCGFLKFYRTVDTHYYVRNLVQKNDTVIDIGGNLGYYTKIFSKNVGSGGKVISVEPVALFRQILEINTSNLKNVEVIPFALGAEEGKRIEMGIPDSGKDFRHGLTKVIGDDSDQDFQEVFSATMHTPNFLFGNLEKCNYIKCDVEGYEIHIIPLMNRFIEKHKPILQVETCKESRIVILPMLGALGYNVFYVSGKKLVTYNPENNPPGDLIFIPN